jgi:hypothetical protein
MLKWLAPRIGRGGPDYPNEIGKTIPSLENTTSLSDWRQLLAGNMLLFLRLCLAGPTLKKNRQAC